MTPSQIASQIAFSDKKSLRRQSRVDYFRLSMFVLAMIGLATVYGAAIGVVLAFVAD